MCSVKQRWSVLSGTKSLETIQQLIFVLLNSWKPLMQLKVDCQLNVPIIKYNNTKEHFSIEAVKFK